MKFDSNSRKLLKRALLISALGVAGNVSADDDKNRVGVYLDNCANLPLVSSIISGNPNTNVCVDAPVALEKANVVFDLNSDAVDSKGRHTGLRHMWMVATSIKARLNAGLMDPEDINIIGVLHGSGINLVLGDTNSPITKDLVEKIFAMKNVGVNINLEVCGVTMHGRGLSNADLYNSDNGMVHVNQGAIGRIINLQQKKFVLIKE
ncbi:MAG: DsrE family protein [Gammaproteobacteria bacterium]|nr:DsrE family protein [Gammaproteobacteria bacterium]MDH5802385.1 DsrE family protein [Gammaproteobacteria bacterium]